MDFLLGMLTMFGIISFSVLFYLYKKGLKFFTSSIDAPAKSVVKETGYSLVPQSKPSGSFKKKKKSRKPRRRIVVNDSGEFYPDPNYPPPVDISFPFSEGKVQPISGEEVVNVDLVQVTESFRERLSSSTRRPLTPEELTSLRQTVSPTTGTLFKQELYNKIISEIIEEEKKELMGQVFSQDPELPFGENIL